MDRKYIKLILAVFAICLIALPIELVAVAQPKDPWGLPGPPGGSSQPTGSGTVRGPGGPPPPPPIICIDTGEPPPKGEKCKPLADIIAAAVAAETEKQKKETEAKLKEAEAKAVADANAAAIDRWRWFHLCIGAFGVFCLVSSLRMKRRLTRDLVAFEKRLPRP